MYTIDQIREMKIMQLNVSDLLHVIKEMKKIGDISNDSEIHFCDGKDTYLIDIFSSGESASSDKKILNLYGVKI
jgi:hypothetical protein